MSKRINMKGIENLELHLSEGGMIDIESDHALDVGIEIRRANPERDSSPEGAIYRIGLYVPAKDFKTVPQEYGMAYIMSDGTILKKGEF